MQLAVKITQRVGKNPNFQPICCAMYHPEASSLSTPRSQVLGCTSETPVSLVSSAPRPPCSGFVTCYLLPGAQ